MYTAETSGLQGQWPNLFKAKAKIMCPRAVLKVDDSPRAPHPCFFLAFLTTWNVRLSGYTTLCLNKTSDLRLAVTFDTRERILIFFGRNVTNKVSSQNTLYYATSNNLCFCTVWQNGKNENCVFHSALPEFNQSLLDFFNLFDSRLILTLLRDSLNLVINAFSSGLLVGMVQEKRSRECCGS